MGEVPAQAVIAVTTFARNSAADLLQIVSVGYLMQIKVVATASGVDPLDRGIRIAEPGEHLASMLAGAGETEAVAGLAENATGIAMSAFCLRRDTVSV